MSDYYTLSDLIQIVPYSRCRLREMAVSGDIPSAKQIKAGGKWLFFKRDVDMWLNKLEVKERICPSIKEERTIGLDSKVEVYKLTKPVIQVIEEKLKSLKQNSVNNTQDYYGDNIHEFPLRLQ